MKKWLGTGLCLLMLAACSQTSETNTVSASRPEKQAAASGQENLVVDSVKLKSQAPAVKKSSADPKTATKEQAEPYDQMKSVAQFSKSVRIGDKEAGVKAAVGEGVPNGSDPRFTVYDAPPVSFLAKDGVIKMISWGRSGSFDEWETDRHIGRSSTLTEAEKAYENYPYKFKYRAGDRSPRYMVINDHNSYLVLEFTDKKVSLIFRCAPDMLDEPLIRNTTYTYDKLRNHPFE